jgi:hypothetical protein
LLHDLWNPEVHCRIHKDSPTIPIQNRINPIPRIDTNPLRSVLILSSHQRLGLPKGLLSVSVTVNILKAILPSSILATRPAHLNLLDLITLTILGNGINYLVPHCGVFSTRHSHPYWAQIFAPGSCLQIPFPDLIHI